MTVREAVAALKARRASAMSGLLEQIQEAGGVKAFGSAEIIDASKAVLVGLDIDGDDLDAAAVEATVDHVAAAVAMVQAFPSEMLGMSVGSALAQAFVEGYVVRALQDGGA